MIDMGAPSPHFPLCCSMSRSNNSATGRRGDDEYVFPDELEGIDWSTVGSIEGDEPKLGTEQTQPQSSMSQGGIPPSPTELPPRPGSSSSSYGFPDIATLDEDDLAELDETERLYGLAMRESSGLSFAPTLTCICRAGEIHENTPSSSAHTLDITRPIARLPTADDLILPFSQPSMSSKRKVLGDDDKPSPLKKSRTLPLECAKQSPKGKEAARDDPAEGVIQAVYDSLMETCSCPM